MPANVRTTTRDQALMESETTMETQNSELEDEETKRWRDCESDGDEPVPVSQSARSRGGKKRRQESGNRADDEQGQASESGYSERREWARMQTKRFEYIDAVSDPEEPVAPLRDQRCRSGPFFEYELKPNQRVIHEYEGVNYQIGGWKVLKARWWDEKWVRIFRGKPVHEPGRKIVRFSEKRLLKFGWLRTWRGSVFASSFMWLQLLLVYIIAVTTFCISYYVQISSSGRYHEVYVNGGTDDRTQIMEIFQQLTHVANFTQAVSVLVAFVLGLYVNKQVNIYWNLRQEFLQSVMNCVQSLCFRMAIYFPHNNKGDQEIRDTILRYGLLSIALLFKDASEIDSWTVGERKILGAHDLSDLVRDRVLTSREKSLLDGCPAKCQVVWVWIASFFTKLCLDGRLPDPLANQEAILAECTKANSNINFLLGRINTQYPLAYSHLVVFMVKILIFMAAVQAGYISAVAFIFRYDYWAYEQIVMMTVMTIFYQGLINIKEHISNPFRDGSTDFSWKMFHTRVHNECKAFFGAGRSPPYTNHERPNPAVLPPQLIVRQVISSKFRH